MNYVVIENTPGYLPEDDDPATFDSFAEALNHLAALNKELAQEYGDEEGQPKYYVTPIVDGGFTYYDTLSVAPLARVVQIHPVEEFDA